MEFCPHGARFVITVKGDVEFIDVCEPCETLIAEHPQAPKPKVPVAA